MQLRLLVFIFIFTSLSAMALEGVDELSKNLYLKNQEVLSLEKNVESKEALSNSSYSGFYPTLSAVGGWGQNKTDDLSTTQKGYLGYIEGKLNLFRGMKDLSIKRQKEIDLELSKIELETKKRDLRLQLTSAAGDMVFLHKLQSILDEEYRVTQNQKQMAEKKVAAGLTGSVDNLEFELRENEIQIEQKQINQKHEEAHQNFLKLFGEDIGDTALEKIEFSSAEKLTEPGRPVLVENSLEYRRAALSAERVENEKNEMRSDFLPSLDLTYSAGRLTPSEDSPLKYNESKYSVLLTIPLFSGFETFYKTRSASLDMKSAQNHKMQKQSDIIAEINILKNKINELRQLTQINDQKLVNSQKYFDLTLAEYKRGVKNSPDLVSATERLFSSKKKKFEILRELEVVKLRLESF